MYQAAPNNPNQGYPNPNAPAGHAGPAYAPQHNPYDPQYNPQAQPVPKGPSEFPAADDPYATEGLSKKLAGNARMGFVRKVFGILTAQLVLTAAGVVGAVQGGQDYQDFYKRHIELIVIALVVYMVCLYALGCYKSVSRSVPINYILLFLFTGAMTYMVSGVVTLYEPKVVMIAAIMTAAMTVGLMLYAATTKEDFTLCGGIVWVLVIVVLVGIISSFYLQNRLVQIFLSCIMIILLSFFIVYDMQLILGDKRGKFEIDDYVFAAMMIYVDIIRLFLEILKLLGKK